MINVGIICDLKFKRHVEFKSYFYAVKNLFHNVTIITKKEQLLNIDLLIIGDDHYDRHKEILQQPGFIDCCNTLDLSVIVMTPERIFGSFFPWNEENYKILHNIKHLYHYTSDVNDCKLLGTKLHRLAISKHYKDVFRTDKKIDSIIFVGSLHCNHGSYEYRKNLLDRISKVLPVKIIDGKLSAWEEYMSIISKYRFVLSPFGNCDIFQMRFYETLAVGSIPLQQVTSETLKYYDIESKFDDCIFFTNLPELRNKIEECSLITSHNEFWAEDNLQIILKDNVASLLS